MKPRLIHLDGQTLLALNRVAAMATIRSDKLTSR
jgi:hypothetical protein